MSLRGKIIALVFFFEAMLFLTAGVLLYQEHQNRVNEALTYISSSLKNSFERNAVNLKRRYATRIKGFVRTTPQIRTAIVQNDRTLLKNAIHFRLKTLQREDDHFYGISFVLGDGTIFYHSKEDKRIGQNVSHFPFVKKSLEQKTPQDGLSLSIAGLAYRFSHPIYAGTTYLGMAVFVVSADAAIETLAQDYGAQGGIFIDKHVAESILFEKGISLDDGTVLAKGVGNMFHQRDFLNRLVGENTVKDFNYKERTFRRFEDLPLTNHRGETIARAVAVLETTKYIHDFNYKLYRTLMIFGVVFSATLASLYFLVGKLLKLEDINHHLASKIQQEEIIQKKLRKLSEIDALTGLYNRRKFEDICRMEWNAARRENRPLSVLLVDIDFFKAYNDHYGHLAGDEALRIVAGILKAGLRRPRDLVMRYGGEEFICLLPETEKQAAQAIAENLRQKVQQYGYIHEFSAAENVITVSIGVSTIIPLHGCAKEDLIDQADKALYQAKNAGRNQVRVFKLDKTHNILTLIR